MIGTMINILAVICGSLLGLLLRKKITKAYEHCIYSAIGLATIVLGISVILPTKNYVYLTLALVIGGILGTVLHLEDRIENLGAFLSGLFVRKELPQRATENARVFLFTSVLFCSGSLAIIGPFEAGAQGNISLLLIKSSLDGSVSILLAATMGYAVMLSTLSLFLYQGFFTLLGFLLKDIIDPVILTELGTMGGFLIVMIGFNLLELRKIKVGNFLPSLGVITLIILAHNLIIDFL